MLKNFTLLFVEDDAGTQEQLKIILKDEVKHFYQAYNGKMGLELYKKEKPDIILTDINMPILSGLDMSEKIKVIDREQPILIMSAFDEKNILLDAINIGIDGFIVKPIDMVQLNNKLHKIAQSLQNSIEAHKAREIELEIKQKEELLNLYNLAHFDALTNIPNRFFFNKKLHQTIIRSKEDKNKVALFFIDLDDFKTINDTHGHKAGDYTLVSIANNIKNVVRGSDIFARIGGDEFALIVDNFINKECLVQLSENIIQAVSTPLYYKNKKINISCSIGISQYKENMSCEEFIHQADMAMYNIKSIGKSHYSFHDESSWV